MEANSREDILSTQDWIKLWESGYAEWICLANARYLQGRYERYTLMRQRRAAAAAQEEKL